MRPLSRPTKRCAQVEMNSSSIYYKLNVSNWRIVEIHGHLDDAVRQSVSDLGFEIQMMNGNKSMHSISHKSFFISNSK